jgi:hypothetical protein
LHDNNEYEHCCEGLSAGRDSYLEDYCRRAALIQLDTRQRMLDFSADAPAKRGWDWIRENTLGKGNQEKESRRQQFSSEKKSANSVRHA